jgi:hypothetical protein
MARAESPIEKESSRNAPEIQIQDEQAITESPVASPTSTSTGAAEKDQQVTTDSPAASSTNAASKDQIDAKSANSPSRRQHDNSISVASSSSSVNQFYQHQQKSRQISGDQTPPNRRRQGTHSHRNSSYEYKETLDATTRHLEVSEYTAGWMLLARSMNLEFFTPIGWVENNQSVQVV